MQSPNRLGLTRPLGVSLAALVLATASGLTGAGGTAAAKVALTWMNWNSGTRATEYAKWVQEFNRINPDIEVRMLQTPWDQISNKVIVGVAGGSAPDIVAVSSTWGESLAEQNVLLDLRPLVAQEPKADIEDIFPSAWQLWQDAQGRQYAYPHDLDLGIMFYNADLFDRNGLPLPVESWTWDALLQMGQKFTRDTNGDGKNDQFAYSSWFLDWYPYIWANGGEILNPDLKTSALGSPAARQAIEWYGKFYPNRLHLMPSAAESVGTNPGAMFAAGRIALQPAGAWYGSTLQEAKASFVYDVVAMPLSYAGKRATQLAGQGLGIPMTCKHPQEAFRFVQYMASREPQSAFGHLLNQTPVRKSVALSKAFVNPDVPPRNKIAFVAALGSYARPDYKTPHWSRIRVTFLNTMNQYFAGTLSLDAALSRFADQLKTLVK